MKLYLITGTPSDTAIEDEGMAPRAIWGGSQAEAAGARKQLGSEGFRRAEIVTSEIDVPTDKQGLIGFLNIMMAGPTVVAAHAKLTAK